jgi:hypothetical protein
MAGFNYNGFKEALKRVQEENHAKLMQDIEKVKAFVEKALTLCLESNANISRMNYPGIEL